MEYEYRISHLSSSFLVWFGIFLSTFFACFHLSSFAAPAKGAVPVSSPLRVCSEPGFFPFEMQTHKGEWIGYDIDLIKMFAKSSGRKVSFVDVRFSDLIQALTQVRSCDVVASAMMINEERQKIVLFSRPTYETYYGALLRHEDIKKFTTAASLNKPEVRIAVQRGTQSAQYVSLNFSKAQIIVFDTNKQTVKAVLEHKADIFIDDSVFITMTVKRKSSLLAEMDPQLFPDNDYSGMGIAFRREDTALKAEFDTFFEKIQKNGELNKLQKYYFEDMTWMKNF